MKLQWAALILAAGLAGAGCGDSAESSVDRPKYISETDTPWATIDALHHDYPDARIDTVKKVPQSDGSTFYDIRFETGGKNTEATYGTFGNRIN